MTLVLRKISNTIREKRYSYWHQENMIYCKMNQFNTQKTLIQQIRRDYMIIDTIYIDDAYEEEVHGIVRSLF